MDAYLAFELSSVWKMLKLLNINREAISAASINRRANMAASISSRANMAVSIGCRANMAVSIICGANMAVTAHPYSLAAATHSWRSDARLESTCYKS